jgi:hypothetical protein
MLQSAILEEWSEVDAEALAATSGQFDKVVALIAERTSRTKALIRRQLDELYRLVNEPPDAEPTRRSGRGRRPAAPPSEGAASRAAAHVDPLLEELERRTAQIMRELRGGLLGDARQRVRENVILSLLIAIGLGFIVGIVYTGPGRGK